MFLYIIAISIFFIIARSNTSWTAVSILLEFHNWRRRVFRRALNEAPLLVVIRMEVKWVWHFFDR